MRNQCKDCKHWIITQKGYCVPQHIDGIDGDDGCPSWKKKKTTTGDDLVEKIMAIVFTAEMRTWEPGIRKLLQGKK